MTCPVHIATAVVQAASRRPPSYRSTVGRLHPQPELITYGAAG
jgi:hypothetical protein